LNNRVQVHHFGLEGAYIGYKYKMLSSFTKNYGSYATYPTENLLKSTNMLFELQKHFEKFWQIDAGISVGLDMGTMYDNNIGIMLKISKKGVLFPTKN